MPAHDPGLHFVVQMALRNALKLVRGLRKQISEAEESVMAGKLLDEIAMSNYEITRRPGAPGQTFPAPTGTDPHKTIRDAVVRAQKLLAAYAHPDTGISCEATISVLLGVLDHKDVVAALAATAETTPAAEPPPGI